MCESPPPDAVNSPTRSRVNYSGVLTGHNGELLILAGSKFSQGDVDGCSDPRPLPPPSDSSLCQWPLPVSHTHIPTHLHVYMPVLVKLPVVRVSFICLILLIARWLYPGPAQQVDSPSLRSCST